MKLNKGKVCMVVYVVNKAFPIWHRHIGEQEARDEERAKFKKGTQVFINAYECQFNGGELGKLFWA